MAGIGWIDAPGIPSCPTQLLPQQKSWLFGPIAQVCALPAERSVTGGIWTTFCGTGMVTVLPSPRCPVWLYPLQYTSPVVKRSHVCDVLASALPPATICAALGG